MVEKEVNDLKNAALTAAADHIRGQREDLAKYRLRTICVTAIACVMIVCATSLACVSIKAQQQTIVEQQYAINAQYAQLAGLLDGAEVTASEYTAEADGDGSISVAGEGNITSGGDVNGE